MPQFALSNAKSASNYFLILLVINYSLFLIEDFYRLIEIIGYQFTPS